MKAPVAKNLKKILPNANHNNPGGSSFVAGTCSDELIIFYLLNGSREQRRMAFRRARKKSKNWAKTKVGKDWISNAGSPAHEELMRNLSGMISASKFADRCGFEVRKERPVPEARQKSAVTEGSKNLQSLGIKKS